MYNFLRKKGLTTTDQLELIIFVLMAVLKLLYEHYKSIIMHTIIVSVYIKIQQNLTVTLIKQGKLMWFS